ncbi:MAG: VOC family protein [Pseudomonadota bacterium]
MSLKQLDHVNINTADLERLVAFYGGVLGLTEGPRPPFSMDGTWLYCAGHPAIHLIKVDRPSNAQDTGNLKQIDHFAFRAEGVEAFLSKLDKLHVTYRTAIVPKLGLLQVFLTDPDGNKIEITFSAAEAGKLSQ